MPILQEQKSVIYRIVNSLAACDFALPAQKIPARKQSKSFPYFGVLMALLSFGFRNGRQDSFAGNWDCDIAQLAPDIRWRSELEIRQSLWDLGKRRGEFRNAGLWG
jgi:hypothetical protein